MLLTLSQPAKPEFDFKPPHDYSPRFPVTTSRFSPSVKGGSLPPLPARSPPAMSQPHRGLPPPSSMTLPDPGRGPPPSIPPSGAGLGPMPAPPSQWQGAEDSMRNWLAAKAEEDKRKQEEEKTRQEGLRLEQRRIEQSMLRDSLQGNVPPNLVPLIFAGIGGANLANASLEYMRNQVAQLEAQAAQQQQQAVIAQGQSPELRRETRLIGQPPPGIYAQAGQPQALPTAPVLPGQNVAQPPHGAFSQSQYTAAGMSPTGRPRAGSQASAPTSAPRPPPQSQLPRLTTNEMQIQQPPSGGSGAQGMHSGQQEQTSSPSIYFHHWVPPTSQGGGSGSGGQPPNTPSGKLRYDPQARRS